MEAKRHHDYENEIKQLKNTIDWIKKESEKLKNQDKKLNKEILALRKEVSSALDERLLLKLQMQQMLSEDTNKMDQVKVAPYFGRIDFKEKHKDEMEVIYIGKFGLYDDEKAEMLVLDWRAPMSNIYYSGMDEEVAYRTPSGMIEGKMHLKRRYVIEERQLIEIHDEKSLQDNLKDSIQKDTGFLIESLNKSTAGRLKEIVATIQNQQNKIIRSESFLPLIVQGVAGSGKTTIALHRMAYIIYNKGQDLETKYMVIAPNKLFLNYIEDILPDLGVDNVFQTTFEEWALGQLEDSISLTSERNQLDCLLSESKEIADTIALGARLRGSILLKKIIDYKLSKIEKTIIDRQDIKFENITLLTYKEIQDIFLSSNQHMPLYPRIIQLGEYIKKRLKDKDDIIKRGIEAAYQKRITTLKQSVEDIEEVRSEIINVYNERDQKIKEIKKWIPQFVKEYIKSLKLPTAKAFYFGIFEEEELSRLLVKQIEPKKLSKIISRVKAIYKDNKIETEDLGPLLYSQTKLYGIKEEKKYAHIVIDEAQDLDEMKLTVLRQVSLNDAFTLVGDLSQGIYGYKGIINWERMMKRVFGDKKYHYYEMTTSYRSTIEIIELANKVISHCDEFNPLMAEPVLRHGSMPQLIRCENECARISQIMKDIEELQKQGMRSICILTESKEQGKKAYNEIIQSGQEIQWIDEEEDIYSGGIAMMPSYLSKGLEFDAVLIYDVSWKKREMTALDIKLLYVMMTRALHHLKLYTVGEALEILQRLL